MFYEPALRDHGLPHDPFKALVVPRPIGWISTVDEKGVVNLAPYSFFNAVSGRPPIVLFGSDRARTGAKDSQRNAETTGEFVVNLATWDLREEMNKTSAHIEGDEMVFAGLEKLPSRKVKPPRVAGSPAHLECRYMQTVQLPGTGGRQGGAVIFGEVVGIHIVDEAIVDGRVDYTRMRPLARLGYMDYLVVGETFSMDRPD
jgi:flavin reductase (DIM6/NTAB) family NADH-FMN oxidoreductase RutF